MTFLRSPLILAAAMLLRRVDAICVEDNCYGALYWNPAGAEECSDHFVTTVIPPPATTTVTIASAIASATTITGPSVGISTVIPSLSIPTYIVRACYGDVSYRFQSACSCIEAGPTTTTVAAPTVTDTVIVPFTSGGGNVPLPPVSPEITPTLLPTFEPLPVPGIPSTSSAPYSCIPIQGPVIVTVHVDETFATTFTLLGSTLCLGETSRPPASPSVCNCASSLPSAPFLPSSTGFANTTSLPGTGSFSTVVRTSSFSGFFNTSTPATSEPSASEEPTSSAPVEPTESSTSFTLEPSSSIDSAVGPSGTSPSTSESATPTAEPSSTEPSSSSQGPSSSASQTPSSTPSVGPVSFVPQGRDIVLQVVSEGGRQAQFIQTDPPGEGTAATNLKSHTTPDFLGASIWRLDAPTGILFQQIDGTWWGAWFGLGLRKQWDSIKLIPADTIISWLTTPPIQRAPLRCVIDFSASDLTTCGAGQWTMLMVSDVCGWALTTPSNPSYAAACPNSEEVYLQAIQVNPDPVGNSK